MAVPRTEGTADDDGEDAEAEKAEAREINASAPPKIRVPKGSTYGLLCSSPIWDRSDGRPTTPHRQARDLDAVHNHNNPRAR